MDDRRASPRYRFYADMEIDLGSKQLRGRVCDISRYGMFIELPDPPELNAWFSGRLALNEPLRVNCVVQRVVPGRGVGVTIVIPEEEGQRRFDALLFALAQGSGPSAASVKLPPSDGFPRTAVAPAGESPARRSAAPR
jgi:PilZ domain